MTAAPELSERVEKLERALATERAERRMDAKSVADKIRELEEMQRDLLAKLVAHLTSKSPAGKRERHRKGR